ncbi:cisplatin damage response ATP-dependent DNA ligase [Sandaracinobacteroides saxicola]|uniref:cisplatin damage response ATP-dependent DNA ligase n=1 Tax=Sandaracinobacteroides saxicola TaxID=2759707 RepID=UPI001FB0F719|nr:cisplatin damage response ATP-dependent DNA ligase [Sandaracinobacteroides saxicola]
MNSFAQFAELLDALVVTPGRNAKLRRIGETLRAMAEPDRGWALAALTGELDLPAVQPSVLRALMEEAVDPLLFRLSRDYVGDLAETVSLLWPYSDPEQPPGLDAMVGILARLGRAEAPGVVRNLLSRLDITGRWAFIKLATGGMRVGAGARLAKLAFAQQWGVDVGEVEELWHGLTPPYAELFAWGEGRGPKPDLSARALFRPFMLAHPLEAPETLHVPDWLAEWKWDGIRVQVVRVGGEARLFSRTGDDVSGSFPDAIATLARDLVLDGELMVRGADGGLGSFNALQQRLGRKAPSAKLMAEAPAFVRAYDLLFDGAEDVRALPLMERRARLRQVVAGLDPLRFDLSEDLEAATLDELAALRAAAPDPLIEGLMLKRRDSAYVAGRRAGLWYKWKRAALTADCVLMYAQRGSGKRSSFYSDFTFGAWTEDGGLLPVGKAYFGFTDEELKWLDKFVRAHTVARFGPVREVAKTLVLEVAFDSIGESSRHKSGLAMRFPRISRIRTDKPAAEADTVKGLRAMVAGQA